MTTNPKIVADRAYPHAASSTTPRPRAIAAAPAAARPTDDPRPGADSGPVAALLTVLRWLESVNGSDLHITTDRRPSARIDGCLVEVADVGVWDEPFVESALRSMIGSDRWARFESAREADVALDLPDTGQEDSRFRVNVSRQRGSVVAAFRRIPRRIRTLDDLGLPQAIGDLADLPRGLVLVTGPAGVGKSTTLAAIVDRINRSRAAHVVTIEDPIEYVHTEGRALIHQREIGVDTVDFPTALRQVLRQDPDVILLGELRDVETISGALSAAETGHLVLATLHTQSAAQSIDRIVDMFPGHRHDQVRAQLALTLKAVISQELLPRATDTGRVVAAEIMVTTPAISNLIRDARHYQIPTAMMAGGSLGMQTMDQALAGLVLKGVITSGIAQQVAHDRGLLTSMVGHDTTSWTSEPVRPRTALPRTA
ncbi:type IV pilus twitching motility protein PilT [Lysobacter korlensis]|uniref:Type IV pilus twitching motility protein PilT n=1 Tax=Lysobacter korlensis TaxID=553636 RepID=A0ABV6RUR8_9GAMM